MLRLVCTGTGTALAARLTSNLAGLCSGNLGSVILEGQADSAQPCSLVLQRWQIEPLSCVLIQALAALDKLCIKRMLFVCQQAVEIIGGACASNAG